MEIQSLFQYVLRSIQALPCMIRMLHSKALFHHTVYAWQRTGIGSSEPLKCVRGPSENAPEH